MRSRTVTGDAEVTDHDPAETIEKAKQSVRKTTEQDTEPDPDLTQETTRNRESCGEAAAASPSSLSSSPSQSLSWMANVSIAVSQLSYAVHDEDPDDIEDMYCFCCRDPCDDADLPGAPRSRETNCMRCKPCYLCHACRFQLPKGGWLCFNCLEPEHELLLDDRTMTRFSLVQPSSFRTVPPPLR